MSTELTSREQERRAAARVASGYALLLASMKMTYVFVVDRAGVTTLVPDDEEV